MELLKKLTQCVSPSGSESAITELIISEIKDYVDEYEIDALGNLIAHKKGGKAKLMFAAHMDEIGVIATFIDDKGFVRFSNVGGISAYNSLYRQVKFINGTVGVIGYELKESIEKLNLSKMYIDIGAKSREEAEKLVRVGDMAAFCGEFSEMGNRVASKAMDDRVGCWLLIRAIQSGTVTDNDVYYVFTVQEELGLRGAKPAAFKIEPDIGIAVDVTRTGDTPNSPTMAVELGKGTCIKIRDNGIIVHPKVRDAMLDCARKNNIKYQLEVLDGGMTDSGTIHLTKSGVPSGTVSVPARNVHSAAEIIDKDDLQNSFKLIKALIAYDWSREE